MKRTNQSVGFAAMIVAAFALSYCSNEEWEDASSAKNKVTIVAGVGSPSSGTRTAIADDDRTVLWCPGDKFYLYYQDSESKLAESQKYEFTTSITEKMATAPFTGYGVPAGYTAKYAFYPTAQYDDANDVFTMNLPSQLTASEASNGPMYAPIADGEYYSLNFKQLAGLLKLTVTNLSADAKKFVLTADKPIAGTAVVDLTQADPILKAPEGDDKSNSVTLDINVATNGAKQTFFIPIPVGTYNLKAEMADDSGAPLANYKATTWTGINVTRKSMLYTEFGFTVTVGAGTDISAAIAAGVPATSDPESETNTSVLITGTVKTTESEGVDNSKILIPVQQNTNVSLNFNEAPVTTGSGEGGASKPLVIEEKGLSESATVAEESKNEVNVAIPQVGDVNQAPSITVNMPNTTVSFAATESAATYNEVIVTTANNTFIVEQGVTIKKLIVKGGNLLIRGGEVEELDNQGGGKITIDSKTLSEAEMTAFLTNGTTKHIVAGTERDVDVNYITVSGTTYRVINDAGDVKDVLKNSVNNSSITAYVVGKGTATTKETLSFKAGEVDVTSLDFGGKVELTKPFWIYTDALIKNAVVTTGTKAIEFKVADLKVKLDGVNLITTADGASTIQVLTLNPHLEVWNSEIIALGNNSVRGITLYYEAGTSNPCVLLNNTSVRSSEHEVGDVPYGEVENTGFKNRSDSRGLTFGIYGTSALTCRIENSRVEGFYYAINFSTSNPNPTAKVGVENSILDGRATLNSRQKNVAFKATNSLLIGRNSFSGPTERFANVVFDYTSGNCSFTAENNTRLKMYNSPQTPNNAQLAVETRSAGNTITMDATTTIHEVESPRLNYMIFSTVGYPTLSYGYKDNTYAIAEGISVTGKEGATVMPELDSDGNTPIRDYLGSAFDQLKQELASGGVIKLYEDVTITEYLTLPADKTASLDLNGHTITASNGNGGSIIVYGKLTLKDSKGTGQIVANKNYSDGGLTYSGGLIEVNGEEASLTIESGTISAVRTTPVSNGQFGVTLVNGGDFTMTGGKIEAGWYAVSGNGNYKTQNSVITIEGGELISTADYAIYLPQSGTTTIKGGKVNGAAGGIAIRRGTLNVEGGEILSTDEGDTGEWSDGTGGLGNAALVIGNNYGDCVINISGGTISSAKNAALIEKVSTSTTYTNTITVSGGTFSDPSVATNYLAQNADVKVVMNKDYTGPGFGLYNTAHNGYGKGAKVAVDLNGHTWNVKDTPLFGSPGYETQYFHLEKETTVTFKNGKIQPADPASARMMIQNYCELTLDKVTLIGGTACDYVVSNNNGSCVMNEATITASAGNCAFDVYSYGSYAGVTVTVNTGSVITGNVEFGGDNGKKNGKLFINGGTFNGDLVVTPEYVEESNSNLVIKGGTFNGSGWSDYDAS